jgi:outer membrane protein assembly factor BamB
MNAGRHSSARIASILGAVALIALVLVSSVAASGSQAVAYQIDPAHTGFQADGPTPPLVQRWSRVLGNSLSTISYPLIAEGKVFVLVDNGNNYGFKLYALDQATGATIWGPVANDLANYTFGGLAYDGGRIFVLDFDGFLSAFEASSGVLVWESYLGGLYPDGRKLYAFTSPPTAFGGTVYLSGGGFGAEMLAVNQQDGTLKWHQAVNSGEHSSPAVSSSGVYVTYSTAATSAFSPTGQLLWQFRAAGGGGGRTPVLFNNRLYVRDTFFRGFIILDASTGAQLGSFDVGHIGPDPTVPAFSGSTGYFGYVANNMRALKALDTATLATKWSFIGDSTLNSAPIVVNGYVYIASYNGTLYALDAQTGATVWTTNLGANMLGPEEDNAKMLTGFAAANGMLVGSAGNRLIAFQSAPTPPILLLDTSGPLSDQVAALDSLLFLRDPFPVVNDANLFTSAADRNTRVTLPVSNLQLMPGEPATSVIVNLIGSNNQSYNIPAEDVRPIPNLAFTQVIFRLPDNLATGICTVTVTAHGQISNPARMTIR